jgi:hypothetical protein
MRENINEHDMTKKMMDIMRGGFKPLLKEEEIAPTAMNGINPNQPEAEEAADVITPKQGDAVFNDELKKLQDTVDPRVKITNFKIYPVDENVIIEGTFLKKESEGSGINFKMSLAAGEIETSMNDIELNDKVSMLLQKLKGYYENWVDEWALKLPNEYRPETK